MLATLRHRELAIATLVAGMALAPLGCGTPKTPDGSDPATSSSTASGDSPKTAAPNPDEGVTEVPEEGGPPKLSDAEKGMLAGDCNLLEPQTYDALKAARAMLDDAFYKDPTAALDEAAALEAAMKVVAKAPQGMSGPDHKKCVALFKKQATREIWEYEPADDTARDTLTACQKSARQAFGNKKLTFGDGNAASGANSPLCESAGPVPAKLAALPYQSKGADWDTPAWRCLKFGLRAQQPFQIIYTSSDAGFFCIARMPSRHGGPLIELRYGGKIEEGEIKVQSKIARRRIELAE